MGVIQSWTQAGEIKSTKPEEWTLTRSGLKGAVWPPLCSALPDPCPQVFLGKAAGSCGSLWRTRHSTYLFQPCHCEGQSTPPALSGGSPGAGVSPPLHSSTLQTSPEFPLCEVLGSCREQIAKFPALGSLTGLVKEKGKNQAKKRN